MMIFAHFLATVRLGTMQRTFWYAEAQPNSYMPIGCPETGQVYSSSSAPALFSTPPLSLLYTSLSGQAVCPISTS